MNPFEQDEEFLVWNRSDMREQKKIMEDFIEDVNSGLLASMKVWGAYGSGKTWYIRILQIELKKQNPNVLFIYSTIPRESATFGGWYRVVIRNLITKTDFLKRIDEYIRRAYNVKREQITNEDQWKQVLCDEEIASILYQIYMLRLQSGAGEMRRILAFRWMLGEKLTTKELAQIAMTYSPSSDGERYEILVRLVNALTNVFPYIILCVDELEEAHGTKLPRLLSADFRDLIDQFSGKFGLILSFTGESEEDWYDLGYTEALSSRLTYRVNIPNLNPSSAVEMLRKHHEVYRKPEFEVEDQLYPFKEEAIKKLVENMESQDRYPRKILRKCGELARRIGEKGKWITKEDIPDRIVF